MIAIAAGDPTMPKKPTEQDRESGNIEHGTRLAKIRREAGLNQAQLGERIGVDQSIISRFENGQRKMYDDILTELAEALGVTPNDILGVAPCKTIKTEEATVSRRLLRNMKQIEELPRRARDKVIATLELALRGAKNSKAS
jgi:transcriptional regulator with XRE-family HTH domain